MSENKTEEELRKVFQDAADQVTMLAVKMIRLAANEGRFPAMLDWEGLRSLAKSIRPKNPTDFSWMDRAHADSARRRAEFAEKEFAERSIWTKCKERFDVMSEEKTSNKEDNIWAEGGRLEVWRDACSWCSKVLVRPEEESPGSLYCSDDCRKAARKAAAKGDLTI